MDWKALDLSHSFSLFLCLSTYLPIYFLCIYLSIYLSINLSISLFHLITYLCIYLSIYLSISLSLSFFHLSICLAVCLSIYPSIYLSTVHLSIYLSSCLPVYLSIYLSEPPKVARTCGALYVLTSKCASRHNGVRFFNIRTSKSGANRWCFVHFDLEICFAPQRRALFRHLNCQKWSGPGVFCTFWLGNVLRTTTAGAFSTSEPPKVARTCGVLCILTSRHNGVRFFDISTAKSGPDLVCFVHFDLETCFAPQRRALFRHRNFQKWSGAEVFCAFWLGNLLRATTACTFSTSQLPKVVRSWGVLYILTCKCASRHNGVQFFISHLARWLRTRRFSEPTFRPSGAPNHWKNTVFGDFPTFSRISIFFLLTLSLLLFFLLIFLFSLPLPCSAFHLSILSEVWLLNFLR